MSTNQMLPIWLKVSGADLNATTMAADVTSDAVKMEWEDNAGIQVKWTGTPTGTVNIQVNQDPTVFDWESLPFSSPAQPTGAAGGDFFDVTQTAAAWIRLKYTRVSGTGALYAKIALKSV